MFLINSILDKKKTFSSLNQDLFSDSDRLHSISVCCPASSLANIDFNLDFTCHCQLPLDSIIKVSVEGRVSLKKIISPYLFKYVQSVSKAKHTFENGFKDIKYNIHTLINISSLTFLTKFGQVPLTKRTTHSLEL